MFKIVSSIAILFISLTMTHAQKEDVQAVKATVKNYAASGDQGDAQKLANYLDPNFRIVMNRLFGSKDVSTLPREVYLEKIRSGEFGGAPRTLTFYEVVINNTTAAVKVKMVSAKLTFHSLMILLKDADGNWKLVSDLPTLE